MRVFLTGAAGFIGFHTARRLLENGHEICGYDNVNDYYDPCHKEARLAVLRDFKRFSFVKSDLTDELTLKNSWKKFDPDHVLNLAAQAGVRYSLENPMAYIQSNVVGFQNVIDLVRHTKPRNFVYASSSSVYGSNKTLPFSEMQEVKSPISLYAATKLANEVVAHSYSHLYQIPATGLRFFTVYGPYSRPDMAIYKFARLVGDGMPISVYNNGKMVRDFTFIDDVVSGIIACLEKPEQAQIYNIGKGSQVNLMDMIYLLEENIGSKAKIEFMPLQAGDVPQTVSDISKAKENLGYDPKVDIVAGMKAFSTWFLEHMKKMGR